MALSWQPLAWWAYPALAALVVLAVAYLAGFFGQRRSLFGRGPLLRTIFVALNLAAFTCLGISLFQPRLRPTADAPQHHLTLVLDASDSMLRTPNGLPALREQLLQNTDDLLNRLPRTQRSQAKVSVVSFGAGTRVHAEGEPLADLPDLLRELRGEDLAPPRASHLDEGLAKALSLGRDSAARSILLYSDGHPTRNGALAVAQRAARAAVPIHTWTPPGALPELAIRDLYLPPVIAEGLPTHLRANLRNQANQPAATMVAVNGWFGADEPREAVTQAEVPGDGWGRLRVPVSFRQRGIHYVDLALREGDRDAHRRRVFAQVTRPPKYLAVGGDNRWVAAFPPERGVVDPIEAEAFTDDVALSDYDALILNDVLADQFPSGALERIAGAVRRNGLGLFFINGDHAGADDMDATTIMSYADTPIEPLLPVSTLPRPKSPEFGERHIVLLVDASGSMGGPRIKTAQGLMQYIVLDLLEPADRLDLIVFTTQALHLVENLPMTKANKNYALKQINGIQPGGGTDPRKALDLLADRHLSNCGLIFISDGFFKPVDFRPDCRPTVFGIGQSENSISPALRKIADPIPVPLGTLPGHIEIPFFDPEERPHFYERPAFKPQRLDDLLNRADRLAMPRRPLPGNAVTKVLPEATLIAIRPKYTDPVLAYVPRDLGLVGAFTSGLPLPRRGTRAATPVWVEWFERVLPFAAFNRYHIAVQEQGDRLVLELNLLAAGGLAPRVSMVDLQWRDRRGNYQTVTTRKGRRTGLFIGTLEAERGPEGLAGHLEIREQGADALPRPQRLAMRLPPANAEARQGGRESEHFGVNEGLLAALRRRGGGSALDSAGTPFQDVTDAPQSGRELRHWFWLAACLLYVAAVALRRLGPRTETSQS